MGSQAFAVLLAFSLVTSQVLMLLSSWLLLTVFDMPGPMQTCTVGFSGVLFALKYVLSRQSPGVVSVRAWRVVQHRVRTYFFSSFPLIFFFSSYVMFSSFDSLSRRFHFFCVYLFCTRAQFFSLWDSTLTPFALTCCAPFSSISLRYSPSSVFGACPVNTDSIFWT